MRWEWKRGVCICLIFFNSFRNQITKRLAPGYLRCCGLLLSLRRRSHVCFSSCCLPASKQAGNRARSNSLVDLAPTLRLLGRSVGKLASFPVAVKQAAIKRAPERVRMRPVWLHGRTPSAAEPRRRQRLPHDSAIQAAALFLPPLPVEWDEFESIGGTR